jgi:hypothetical protein
MTNREELLRLMDRVRSLLTEPNFHPGLMTWQEHYHDAVKELQDWLNA